MKSKTTKLTIKLFLISLFGIVLSCTTKSNNMKLNLTQMPVNGLTGNLQKGVSATYAALIDGKLIVAGGANFPDKLGFEGGSKAFYDEIMLFDNTQNAWRQIGKLPQLSAYGVSVPISDGALWIGGNTATESLTNCYKVTLDDNDSVTLDAFPALPSTMDNFAGCSLNDVIFVGGGSENGKPSNSLYCINAKTDTNWTKLPDFPGTARVQPIMASIEKEGITFVYLLGGFFGGNATEKPTMATDVLRYDVAAQKWEKVGEQIDVDSQKPFSLGGATAMPVDNRYILCLGGVNHDVFLDAITTQYNIANDTTTSAEEKGQLNYNFSKNYMTQPIEYYKFNPECRVFDTETGIWTTLLASPDLARAGATLVYNKKEFYAVQGELKPGVRSAVTIKGELKQ
ncbi:MAG: N-acetylneuraminate epimerase precursor [Bacteroidetes bacterium ADurb.BinA174]|nr:MAG: N-acetylneuraminate epimerase precursor [Bacteroidetes bacterium ADurb.BinA174]